MSLLIKNVHVVDGTGSEPYKADVFCDRGAILAIGDLKKKQADEVVDGLNNFLTPGFIDIDTASDHYLSLFTNPGQSDFLQQGVTTIIGGHCGSSLAPLIYGNLDSVRKWANPDEVNVNWHSVKEFLAALNKLPLGVNFGTLVGHSTVRRALTGEGYRDLARDEMAVFKKTLHSAMAEGAFGLSTGLGYAHGRLVGFEEIKDLVEVIKSFDGIYSTHLRDEKNALLASVEESIDIAQKTGVKTIISHLRPLQGFEKEYEESYRRIESARSEAPIYFYVYPDDTSVLPIYKLLPLWAQEKNLESMLQNIQSSEISKKIEADLDNLDFSKITIADAPKHEYLIAKTVNNLADAFGVSPGRALIKIMETTKLRASVFHKDINHSALLELLKDPNVFIASNAASRLDSPKFLKHERAANAFTKYLDIALSAENGNMPNLPEVIKRITSRPAEFMGIKKRGIVKEGFAADLAILDKDNYAVKETFVGGRSKGGALQHQA